MKVKVYAKLNLSLNVVGQKDGYHLLDALTTSIDIFDTVKVNLRDDGQITVKGVDIPQEQNVAYKAAKSFFATFGGNGCDIVIQKGIPFSQGLGGSSADASATVYCLAKLMGIDLHCFKIKQVCDSVGSDVYFMLHGGFGKIVGRSGVEMLSPVSVYGCLTVFDHKSDTASVFRQYDAMPTTICVDNNQLVSALRNGDTASANDMCFNALQGASSTLCGYASKYTAYCKTLGVKATMTGSGSAYFVLCSTKKQAQDLAVILSDKGFKSMAFQSVSSGIEQI